MNFYDKSIQETISLLQADTSKGLSDKQVHKRQKQYSKNRLDQEKKTSLTKKFFSQFSNFMILILIFAAILSAVTSFFQGETDFIDSLIIFAIVFLNAFLGTLQESKAERSLESLKKLSSPTTFVLRNGKKQSIPSEELVPGDLIFLETGQFVPADARLLTASHLQVDESSLTGESHPVDKNCFSPLSPKTPLAERANSLMAGSSVVYGHGTAIVTTTGMNTEIGTIAKLISEEKTPPTPLQQKLSYTGKVLGIVALIICFVIFLIGVLNQKPFFFMFMTSVSLAVAAIPEGLPAIVTIMLSLGVQRMAKKNAVIRKLPAVETLGSATVICSDKTGTLTQNKMTVTTIFSAEKKEELSSSFARFLFSLGVQCNNALEENIGMPTETALLKIANQENISKSHLELLDQRLDEIPFDSSRKRMTTLHKNHYLLKEFFSSSHAPYYSITKGAAELLLPLCSFYYSNGQIFPMTEKKRIALLQDAKSMATLALRTLAITFRTLQTVPAKSQLPSLEKQLVFVGLIGMIDPPRKEAFEAVALCKQAGIRPVMITGDHPLTACAIGRELGILSHSSHAITGSELSSLSQQELERKIYHYEIFARVTPEHKVRIVKAFQKNGEIVAMTGDGVNDSPALKAADIGCAMGETGTDVAKNAADMILTDDNFSTIVAAVREGRSIYDNIEKSIHFLLSSNIGEIITIFVAILFGLSSPLLAVQLLWVNLVTDSFPAIALGMEPPEKNIMHRPPISPKKSIFHNGMGLQIFLEGSLIGILSLTAFILGIRILPGANLTLGRTMCFAVLSLSQLFHAFNMRSSHSIFHLNPFRNPALIFSFFACAFLLIGVISVPSFATVFKVTPLSTIQWIFVFLLSIVPIVVVEMQKRFK